ncbi:helix-turn-helix domain-containing protein [Streptococcus caprae]|uniref:Helix-turn-helix domain-containing protein n=1 Tax=Streptococcus caprae TaxID=1640501 RepID=A0ABV8CUD8_9STRE
MEISQLMEKTEAGIYRLLCQLKETTQAVPIKQLCQESGLSKATVLKYLEYYQEDHLLTSLVGPLVVQEDSCQLLLVHDVDWSLVLDSFLDSSIKYQILLYLLDHSAFAIQKLSQQLRVSEATFHRHLSGLNELLKEFDCGIYNGHWKGPEHQIRYFYWCLLRRTWSIEQLQDLETQPDLHKEVQVIERLCQTTLLPENRQAISLWILISHKRWNKGNTDSSHLSQLLQPYQNNIFYQRLERACLRYFSRYAVELDEGEAHNIFAFLVSLETLPAHTMTFLLGFGGPVADQMTVVIQHLRAQGICGQHLPHQVTEVLGRILHRQYFFQGTIWSFQREYNLETAYFIDFVGEKQSLLVDKLLPGTAGVSGLTCELRWHLLSLLAFLNQTRQEKLRIALDMSGGDLALELVKASLEKELAYNRLLEFLPYQLGEDYDGLITNQALQRHISGPSYRLHGPLQKKDQQAIAAWLQDLLLDKEEFVLPSFPSY